jgi:hypothetical protein
MPISAGNFKDRGKLGGDITMKTMQDYMNDTRKEI